MDITALFPRILEALWSITDVPGVVFAIAATFFLREYIIGPDPPDPKDRTFLQKHLPVIPVVLGSAFVIALAMIGKESSWSKGNWQLLINRAVGTGTFSLFAHKYFTHWWKGQ